VVVAAAVVVAALALGLTALTQRRGGRFEQALRTRDVFCLLPLWTFFAPNPGTTDTRLLWRESLGPGQTSHWHELSPPGRRAWSAVWNPKRRIQKAITDAGALLSEARARDDADVVMLSVAYLMLLGYVTVQVGSPRAFARQFILVQTSGEPQCFDEVKVLFVSRWHVVPQPERLRLVA
jgi:hypothetical protein